MENRFGTRVLFAVLLAAVVAAAVGFSAYNAGVTRGLAESGRFAVAAPATPGAAPAVPYAYAYPYPYMWHRPWGFGFGFFPFFFVLLCFFLLRGAFWGGPRGDGTITATACRRASRNGIAARTNAAAAAGRRRAQPPIDEAHPGRGR